MRIVAISDTHNEHDELTMPDGDVLIHAGDATMDGSTNESLAFLEWFSRQPFAVKIFVPGNHDGLPGYGTQWAEISHRVFKKMGVALLVDAQYFIDDKVSIYGAPWIPRINGHWNFELPRGSNEMKAKWAAIPQFTTILVTHTPQRSVLDGLLDGDPETHVGCDDLHQELKNRPHIQHHIFGHIHEHGGESVRHDSGMTSWNVAILDGNYKLAHEPTIIEL